MALIDSALNANVLYNIGLFMILTGIVVIIVAFALIFILSVKSGKARGGGALIIGPFPIVFGTDKESIKTVLLLSIILTIIAFAFFIAIYLLSG